MFILALSLSGLLRREKIYIIQLRLDPRFWYPETSMLTPIPSRSISNGTTDRENLFVQVEPDRRRR